MNLETNSMTIAWLTVEMARLQAKLQKCKSKDRVKLLNQIEWLMKKVDFEQRELRKLSEGMI